MAGQCQIPFWRGHPDYRRKSGYGIKQPDPCFEFKPCAHRCIERNRCPDYSGGNSRHDDQPELHGRGRPANHCRTRKAHRWLVFHSVRRHQFHRKYDDRCEFLERYFNLYHPRKHNFDRRANGNGWNRAGLRNAGGFFYQFYG